MVVSSISCNNSFGCPSNSDVDPDRASWLLSQTKILLTLNISYSFVALSRPFHRYWNRSLQLVLVESGAYIIKKKKIIVQCTYQTKQMIMINCFDSKFIVLREALVLFSDLGLFLKCSSIIYK